MANQLHCRSCNTHWAFGRISGLQTSLTQRQPPTNRGLIAGHGRNQKPVFQQSQHRCRAFETPQPLLLWAVEAAEDPDFLARLISLAAVDLAIAALFLTSFANTLNAKDRRRLVLPESDGAESSVGALGRLGGSIRSFVTKTASWIPTGSSFLILAEQEPAMTAEETALEDCLMEGLNADKSLATEFLLLFLTSFKRTWLANTISEAVMMCCYQQKCSLSLSAADLLLAKISNPKAEFKRPLEPLMVNGELMEAIGIYSLFTVMRARGLFKWIDSMMAFL